MAITVYYGSYTNTILDEPEPLGPYLVNLLKDNTNNVLNCPALKEAVKNTFILKYPYDYQVEWDGETISSKMYNQEFFDKELLLRSQKLGFLTIHHPDPIFYTEHNDLEIEQLPAYLHKNEFTQNGHIIPGKYNIGKHLPRKLEAAYKFAYKTSITLNEGDVLFYIKFNTDEDIIFKRFVVTKEFWSLATNILSVRERTKRIHSLQFWYNLIAKNKLKKYFIKVIKQNLL